MDDMGIWFRMNDLIPGRYEWLSEINLEELNPISYLRQIVEHALAEKEMGNCGVQKEK